MVAKYPEMGFRQVKHSPLLRACQVVAIQSVGHNVHVSQVAPAISTCDGRLTALALTKLVTALLGRESSALEGVGPAVDVQVGEHGPRHGPGRNVTAVARGEGCGAGPGLSFRLGSSRLLDEHRSSDVLERAYGPDRTGDSGRGSRGGRAEEGDDENRQEE